MNEPTITCTNCGAPVKLTETLAAPLLESTRKDFARQLAEKDKDVARREAALAAEKSALEEQVASRLKVERERIRTEEQKRAQAVLATDIEQKSAEIAGLQSVLQQREAKLAEALAAQADLERKKRALDDEKREMDLTIEKRVSAGTAEIRQKAQKDADLAATMRLAEKDHTITQLAAQIEELKRRAEQGSQQLQGEAQELVLENLLRTSFPRDSVEPVGKGVQGGDVVQQVFTASGHPAGSILWESKRTRNWSDSWLAKVRDDMRTAGADIPVIATQVLPKGLESFGQVEGVWVCSFRYAIPLAAVLRQSLLEVTAARKASEGQQTKMELIYGYVTGPQFRNRVQAVVEHFSLMLDDLNKEKKVMAKAWAKREKQILGVMSATSGMYGDVQGIAGKAVPEIEGLSAGLLAGPPDEGDED